MTAIHPTTQHSSGGIILALAALAIGALLLVSTLPWGMPKSPEVTLPGLTAHALAHKDAKAAWHWVQGHGRFCKYDCDDGRTRYVCAMPENRWAIVVLEAERLVTAFTADHDYALDAIDGCHNPWHYAHP